MKTSYWAFALFGTSVLAASGCQQPPKANVPCAACAQQKWPVARESRQAAVVSNGVNASNEQIILVPDPGPALPPPSAAFPRQEPDPLPTMAVPAVVTPPTPASPTTVPMLPALPPLSVDRSKTSPPALQPGNTSGRPASDWTAPAAPAPILPPAGISALPMSTSPPTVAPLAAPAAPTSASQAAGFSHSADYQVLTGQVQSFRQDWKLRYADYASVDPYGGSVILEGVQLDKLQNGCQVRVQGRLIPPADRAGAARFQVQSVDVIGQ